MGAHRAQFALPFVRRRKPGIFSIRRSWRDEGRDRPCMMRGVEVADEAAEP
jgi:hypothetical protein